MKYVLGDFAAKRVSELIKKSNSPGYGLGGRGGSRLTTHVEVTGEQESNGYYPGVPVAYVPISSDWISFDPCYVLDSHDTPLSVGEKYIGICYGLDPISNMAVIVTDVCTDTISVSSISFTAVTDINPDGCGITFVTRDVTLDVTSVGSVLGFTVSEESEYAVDLSACCECSDSSSSSDDCAGWYCCEETNTVHYVADCDELDALIVSCESSLDDSFSSGDFYLVEVACAGSPLSSILRVEVTSKAGTCDCIPDEFFLEYVGTGSGYHRWEATLPLCDESGGAGTVWLQCEGGFWQFGGNCIGFASGLPGESFDPFYLPRSTDPSPFPGRCCAGLWTFAVTEYFG